MNGSGNVNVGGNGPGHAAQCGCHKHEAAKAAPAGREACRLRRTTVRPALSSAQPSGQLAFTGSDVSVPLTVGLWPSAGIGLTALGRRREIQTA